MDLKLSSPVLGNTDLANMINGDDDANFDQFIRGDTGASDHGNPNFAFPDYHFGDCLFDNQFAGDPIPADMFGHVGMAPPEADCVVDSLPSIELDMMMMIRGVDVGEFNYNDDDSSGTTTTNTTTDMNPTASMKKHDVDRSRTLVSERRRRHRMKEKLYALRSLVPNITKMDKASIVGDAALYVQQLQMQAKKLKSEIAGLEASLSSTSAKYHGSFHEPKKIQLPKPYLPLVCTKIIIQMDVFQVEERGFYVRLVCNKGEGIAASLYKALEVLSGLIVQSSNLVIVSKTFVLTFNLNARENEQKVNVPNLKLWVTGALVNQGFDFRNQMSG